HLLARLAHRHESAFANGPDREVLDAALAGDQRPVPGIGTRVMHGHCAQWMSPDEARTFDEQLKLVLPMEVRSERHVRRLLDQEHGRREHRIVAGLHPFALEEGFAHYRYWAPALLAVGP